MAKASVSRCEGIPCQVGVLPTLVGCGYSGATPELDGVVQDAANKLTATFRRDVQIRFNSDRLSGGAFLSDGLTGLSAFTAVHINAGLVPIRPPGMSQEDWWKADFSFMQAQPKALRLSVHVRRSWLKDPSLAHPSLYHKAGDDDGPGDFWEPDFEGEMSCVDEAIAWLQSNLRQEGG